MFGSNLKAVGTHSKVLSSETQTMSTKMDNFMKLATQHLSKIKGETEQFHTKELEALSAISNRLKEQLEKVQESLLLIHAKEESSKEAVDVVRATITGAQESMQVGFDAYAKELRKHCESVCKEAEASSLAGCEAVCDCHTCS